MRTIAEWQKLSYANARDKGFHDCKACPAGFVRQWELSYREGRPEVSNEEFDGTVDLVMACQACNGTGLAPLTPTRIGARLAAIHAEIAEAYECVARGRMELYFCDKHGTFQDEAPYSGRTRAAKPEGFGIELADVFLRLCDFAESLGFELQKCAVEPCEEFEPSNPEHVAAALNDMHTMCSEIRANDPEELALTDVFYQLINLSAALEIDLLAMAELKHAYNLTRPRMNGKIL
jgi:NTP pyrophosphatase (non-canonical NTP hydrolase)